MRFSEIARSSLHTSQSTRDWLFATLPAHLLRHESRARALPQPRLASCLLFARFLLAWLPWVSVKSGIKRHCIAMQCKVELSLLTRRELRVKIRRANARFKSALKYHKQQTFSVNLATSAAQCAHTRTFRVDCCMRKSQIDCLTGNPAIECNMRCLVKIALGYRFCSEALAAAQQISQAGRRERKGEQKESCTQCYGKVSVKLHASLACTAATIIWQAKSLFSLQLESVELESNPWHKKKCATALSCPKQRKLGAAFIRV